MRMQSEPVINFQCNYLYLFIWIAFFQSCAYHFVNKLKLNRHKQFKGDGQDFFNYTRNKYAMGYGFNHFNSSFISKISNSFSVSLSLSRLCTILITFSFRPNVYFNAHSLLSLRGLRWEKINRNKLTKTKCTIFKFSKIMCTVENMALSATPQHRNTHHHFLLSSQWHLLFRFDWNLNFVLPVERIT